MSVDAWKKFGCSKERIDDNEAESCGIYNKLKNTFFKLSIKSNFPDIFPAHYTINN